MRDVKQASFRLNSDDTERFKAFCEESEMTAAQGFSVLLEIMELDRAGRALPARKTEIENFEQLTKAIVSAYLHSLELNENAENRIRDQFATQLETQSRTIADYQEQVNTLQLQLEEAVNFAESYRSDSEEMQKRFSEAEKKVRHAESELSGLKSEKEKQLSDKENIIAMLTDKLMIAERKAEGYDSLEAQNKALETNLAIAEQTIKDNAKDAEIERERALNALERKMDKEHREAQEQLASQVSVLQQTLLLNEQNYNKQIRALDKENAGYRETILGLNAQLVQQAEKDDKVKGEEE